MKSESELNEKAEEIKVMLTEKDYTIAEQDKIIALLIDKMEND